MAISFDRSTKTFYLDGKNLTYAFTIDQCGYAKHLYFGAKIPHDPLFFQNLMGMDEFPAILPGDASLISLDQRLTECSFYGTGDYREACVLAQNAEGDRLTNLFYESHEILAEKPAIPGMPSLDGGETLVLHLLDRYNGFGADLYYTVYDDTDVIARRIVFRNTSKKPFTLKRAYSFSLSLFGRDYDMISLYGAWGKERMVERYPLHNGVSSIDSKRLTSSPALNPFMAIVRRDATEDLGEAYGVNLVYSSSYVLKAQVTESCHTLLTGGINDFDFEWKLGAGEEFATPEVVIAYSNEGIGGMSRAFHDAYRNHLIDKRRVGTHRPLVINNWEATHFNFTEQKLFDIIDAAKDTGIDTFVLDDGWFGIRDDAHTSLGDWFVYEKKLPNGLKAVIDHTHEAGLKFGLWFEPEMISENSEIYRAHPDYAIAVPGRKPCEGRYQLMMDLTRQDVRDYIVDSVNKIIQNYEIDYVKWDYNRSVSDQYTQSLPAEKQMEFAHRYVLGVYEVFDRIVNGNPEIFFEGCSSGGGRFDPAVLAYFPQIWTSDDSDAEERTMIQYGTSLCYPLSSMACHVSKCPNKQCGRITPFATRAAIAHLGATGYELDTTEFSAEEREQVKKQVRDYYEIEDLVLNGDLYRIDSPFEGNWFSEALVSKDKSRAYLLCYNRMGFGQDPCHIVRMKGLDPQKRYFIPELNLILSGATLMNVGFTPKHDRDFSVTEYHFEEK